MKNINTLLDKWQNDASFRKQLRANTSKKNTEQQLEIIRSKGRCR